MPAQQPAFRAFASSLRQGPPPANDYRRIASQSGYVSALRARPELTNFEIAGLRPAVAPQPGEWSVRLAWWRDDPPPGLDRLVTLTRTAYRARPAGQ